MRLALAGLFACSEVTFHEPPPWGSAPAVLVTLDGDRSPIAAPRLLSPGDPFFLRVDRGEVREVVAVAFGPGATAPDGSPIVECGVAFAGAWAFASPSAIYSTGRVEAGADDLALVTLPAGEPLPFALRHERCLDEPDPCEGLDVDSMPAPGIGGLLLGAPISDTSIVYVRQSGTGAIDLVRVDDFDVSTVALDPPLTFYMDGAAIFDSVVYLAGSDDNSEASRVVAVGLDGRPRPAPDLRVVDLDPEIAIGFDGAAVIGGRDGVRRFTAGSTIASPIDPTVVDIAALAVVSGDRMVVVDSNRGIHVGGAELNLEWLAPIGSLYAFNWAAADSSQILVSGTLATLLRKERRDPWSIVEAPEMFDLPQVAALQGGRFAVRTQLDHFAIHTGSGWCRFPEEDRYAYTQIAASPSGLTLYLAGRDRQGEIPGTIFKRVQLAPR